MNFKVKRNLIKFRKHWYVLLFPIIALILSGYLFQQHYYNKGLLIHISFDDAAVLQTEKTKLRFRGVDIGVVKKLNISKDKKTVIVSVQLAEGTDEFAVEGSRFWVVTPKVSLQGLTGLDTIFAGPYIEVLPGPAGADPQVEFQGRQQELTQDAIENTSNFSIETSNAENLNTGDAITYRGLNVGTIGKIYLGKTGQLIEVQINIQNKYAYLIRTGTVFWSKVGIQAKLGLFGSNIKVNSMDSIMHGGLEFSNPDQPGERAKAGAKFNLAPSAPKNYEKWNPALN